MTNITTMPKKPKPPAQPPTGDADFIAIASRLSALLGLPVPTESIARVVSALDHCYERGHKAAMESAQISLQNANEARKKSQLETENLKERPALSYIGPCAMQLRMSAKPAPKPAKKCEMTAGVGQKSTRQQQDA